MKIITFLIAFGLMLNAANIQMTFNPTHIPALLLAGKYLITPGSANGNMQDFFKLANGIVSNVMLTGATN